MGPKTKNWNQQSSNRETETIREGGVLRRRNRLQKKVRKDEKYGKGDSSRRKIKET